MPCQSSSIWLRVTFTKPVKSVRSFLYSRIASSRTWSVQRRVLQTQMFPRPWPDSPRARSHWNTHTHTSATEGGRKIACPEVTTALLGLSILLLVRALRQWPRRPTRYLGRPPSWAPHRGLHLPRVTRAREALLYFFRTHVKAPRLVHNGCVMSKTRSSETTWAISRNLAEISLKGVCFDHWRSAAASVVS